MSVPYIIITDTEMAINIISTLDVDKPVFADIETEVLYDKVRLIQLYQPHLSIVYIIDIDYCDLQLIKDAITPLHTVWAGAYYDFGTLNMTTNKFDDVQLATRNAYPDLPAFDLSTITYNLVDKSLYEGLDKKALQKAGFKLGAMLSEEQLRYSSADVVALSKLWELPRIQAELTKQYYKLDMKLLAYTIVFQQNGALVDTRLVREELDKIPNILAKEEEALNGVNSKSVPQVKDAFAKLGLTVEGTSKEVLIDLITRYKNTTIGDFVQAVYDNRRTRLRQTNLEKLNRNFVMTKFNPYGTVTGRYSSTGGDLDNGINFQNITRDLQYLTAQDTEDTVVIHADYSTAELRSACSLMGDHQMREYLLNDVDLHKVSATLANTSITLDNVNKEDRQRGKAVSFGFVFGMSADRFKEYAYTDYGVLFTTEESREVKANYQRLYPDITMYHKYWWNNYKTEYVTSPLGRKNKPRLGTDAINYATQASIGECIKLAIHLLVKEDSNVLKYLYSQVHDAVYLRVPKDLANKYGYMLVKCMLEAWYSMLKLDAFKFKDIPMLVDIELSSKANPMKFGTIQELDLWLAKEQEK